MYGQRKDEEDTWKVDTLVTALGREETEDNELHRWDVDKHIFSLDLLNPTLHFLKYH
jgi:hypothetical protein